MELVSETDEQMTVPDEATVKTRCLAMFANPMRERAAMNRVKISVKNLHIKSRRPTSYVSVCDRMVILTILSTCIQGFLHFTRVCVVWGSFR